MPARLEELDVPDELYFEYRESVPGLEDIALYGTASSTTRADGQVDQLFVTFVWQGGRVAVAGIAVGTLAAVALTRYIKALLFDVGQLDVLAFAGMSAVMLAVALLASYVPALRASRVDPVVALQAE